MLLISDSFQVTAKPATLFGAIWVGAESPPLIDSGAITKEVSKLLIQKATSDSLSQKLFQSLIEISVLTLRQRFRHTGQKALSMDELRTQFVREP